MGLPYAPVNSKTAQAPRANPQAFDFFKNLVRFPGMLAV